MKNFIEVTCDKKKILINVNQISIVQYDKSSIQPNECFIAFSVLHNGTTSHYTVEETYEEVKQLIEAAI